jgi:hypothetical protein
LLQQNTSCNILILIVRGAAKTVQFLRGVLLLLATVLTDVGVDKASLLLCDVDTGAMEPV